MSKAAELRQKLAANNNRLAYDAAINIIGSRNAMGHMLKSGELTIEGEGDEREVVLDPGYKARRTLPIKRKAGKRAKKTAHKKRPRKAARSGKTFKELADKIAVPADRIALEGLVIENLLAAGDNLLTTLADQVEGLDRNPAITNAIAQHRRTVELARAAGIACPF